MKRFAATVALGVLLSVFGGAATATPALAGGGRGDGWVYQDFGPGFTTTNCGFLVQATQDVDNVFAKALKAPDGSMILLFTGAAKITFANPANGKSVSTNVSGPATITVNPDGTAIFAMMGPGPVDLTPADAARLGLPALFVFAGKGMATVDAAGNIISASLKGHILVNVCATLS